MKFLRIIFLLYLLGINACEEAVYKFDNVNDPFNMDLEPPALFFHPSEIKTFVNSNDSLEIYGLKLDSSAAAHLEIIYDYGSIIVDSVSPGPFFQNSNDPIEVVVEDGNKIHIYLYYLPDVMMDQNTGGTWSLAKIYFSTTNAAGTYGLEFGSNTKLTTTITVEGIDSGARTTIPIEISKEVIATRGTKGETGIFLK